MSVNIVLLGLVAVLYSAGVYLLLERSLTRVLLGVLLLGNATNLLLLSSGGAGGRPPIVGVTPDDEMSDPLAQAMILTAIVITLGIAAFLLAMIYRNWVLEHGEDIAVDVEDVRVARGRLTDTELDIAPGEASYDSGDDTDTEPTRRRWRMSTDDVIRVLTPLPVLLPLLGAAVALIVGRHPRLQRALSIVVLAAAAQSRSPCSCSPTGRHQHRSTSAAGPPPSASRSSSTGSPR